MLDIINQYFLICNFVYKQELGTHLSFPEFGFPLSYYSLSSTEFDVMQSLLSIVNLDFYLIFPRWNEFCKKSWSVIQKGWGIHYCSSISSWHKIGSLNMQMVFNFKTKCWILLNLVWNCANLWWNSLYSYSSLVHLAS